MNIYICKTSKKYQTAGKFDDQQHYKDILEAEIVSTPEVCNDNIMMTPNRYESTKNPIAIKSLCQFSEALDVKHKTSVSWLGAAKSNCKSIRRGNVL